MKQLSLNYPPIWIERRLSRKHVAFSGRFRWRVIPFIAVKLGFGISYLPEVQVSIMDQNEEIYLRARSDEQVNEHLFTFLRSVQSTRSLEIRNSISALDYSSVSTFRKISRLSIFGPISKPIDLSSCHKLEALVINHRSGSKIHGLSDLNCLKEIHIQHMTRGWLTQVPNSLEVFYLSGSLPQELDMSGLGKLESIIFQKMRLLTFESFSFQPANAKHLVIEDVRNVTGLDGISKAFPKLEVVSVKGDCELWLAKLKQSSMGKFEVLT